MITVLLLKHLKRFMPGILFGLGTLSFSPVSADTSTPLVVRYPLVKGINIYKTQSNYFHDLFKLALNNSGIEYRLEYVSVPSLSQSRSIKLIGQKLYDAHWMTTNSEREERLLPVRVPLLKGLLGLRVGLVKQENLALLKATKQDSDLAGIRIGQGHDWNDTQILQASNISVVKAGSTDALYDMLDKGRIEYFPRSVIEYQSELEALDYTGLIPEPNIALYYPQAVYFFTHPDNVRLNRALTQGIKTAIANGQFDALFKTYFAKALESANMSERLIIQLRNKLLPPQTPLDIKEYWYAETLLSSPQKRAD